MAVDPLALSLADYALLEDRPERRRNIAMDMIKANSVLTYLKAETDPTLALQGTRYIGLPDDQAIWKPLNTEPTEYKALPTPYSEQAYQFAVKMDIAIMILKNEENKRKGGGAALFDKRVKAFLKFLSYDFNTKFFKNSHLKPGTPDNDVNCFVGLYGRLRDPDNKFTIPAENKINANGLDLSSTGITGDTVNALISLIQGLMYSLDEPNGDNIVIAMNEDTLTKIEFGIRKLGAGGGFSMVKDAFERSVMTYRNAKITTAGRRVPDQNGNQAQIITDTETANGLDDTGGTFTSIVAYKTNSEDLGIKQFMELDATEPYKLENGTHMRTVVQNAYMIDQESIRSIGRIFNIKKV